MANFKVQEFMDALSAEAREKVKNCKTAEELGAIVEAEGIDITAFADDADEELSLNDLEDVAGGKGGVIAATLATALAAITFASCGSEDILPKSAPANAARAVTTSVTVQETQPVQSAQALQVATGETQEAMTAETEEQSSESAEKTSKKDTKKKKKKSAKTETAAENVQTQPAQNNTQPIIIVQAAQPAQQTQAAQPAAQQQTKQTQPKAQKKQAQQQTVIPETYAPVYVDGDVYAGKYAEKTAGVGYMEITNIGNYKYAVRITWKCDAHEYNTWDVVGEFDGRGTMNYTGCIKNNHKFDTNGSEVITTEYTNGSGYFKFEDLGELTWNDNMGDILPGTTFRDVEIKTETKTKKKTKTKADEVGTAGSKYYENEGKPHTKADEVGTAGSRYYENEGGTEFYYYEDEFATGFFYDLNGSKVTLEIRKSGLGDGSYDAVVTVPVSIGEFKTYGCNCRFQADGTLLVYDSGAISRQIYDENGVMIENSILDQGNFGHFRMVDGMVEWFDNDGCYYQFVKN